MKHWRTPLLAIMLALVPVAQAADSERTVRQVSFDPGRSSTTIKGSIKGYNYTDYQFRLGAGQTMKAAMKGSNAANHFNVIAPGASDVAMYMGEIGGNKFEGVLPIEGTYTLRVYLMRVAARRNETSDYSIDVAVTGKALKPLPGSADAKHPGTPFHAAAPIACTLPYQPDVKQCESFVIRRDFQGTATVEVRGPGSYLRRILFMQGKPVASDSSQPMTSSRRDDITEVKFGDDERVEIVDALVNGG